MFARAKNKHDETTQMGIDNINALLDSFMGINDSELAEQVITNLVRKHTNKLSLTCFRGIRIRCEK